MKNNNTRNAFTTVEILLVVSAVLVFCYIVSPVVKSTGSAIGRWMSTPTATATAAAPACPSVAQQAAALVDNTVSVLKK